MAVGPLTKTQEDWTLQLYSSQIHISYVIKPLAKTCMQFMTSTYTQCSSHGVCTSCSCTGSIESFCTDDLQETLDRPVPWIGMYIAAASAACVIAMAADAINGFRRKKLWFPSKYFALNAFSLTVLAVAMKLPVDLTNEMEGEIDRTVRVTSLVLMSTVMTNFMASLGTMENSEILLNLAGLGVLVITIAGNVFIRVFQINHYYGYNGNGYVEETGCIVFLLILLLLLCSSALMVPTAKRYIESQYNQMRKRVLNYEQVSRIGKYTNNELRAAVKRYWVMAESGNPQFVTARSVTCVASDVICLLLGILMLTIVPTIIDLKHSSDWLAYSSYKWSTKWIIVIQYIGVALGTIYSLLRCLTAAQLKSTKIGHKSFKDEFKVEAYWTQTLRQWRDSPLPLKLGHHRKFRRILHDAKTLLLNFYIAAQIFIVLTSKLCLLVSAVIVKGLMFCYSHIKANNYSRESDDNTIRFESRADQMEPEDSSQYVLLLEGEELPKWMLKNICNEMDKIIRKGKRKQSKNMVQLLQKSVNFNGVREFDSSEIQSLHSHEEPPNCWTLPVVTLTIIAISLPNITDQMSDQLLSAVSEGLYFAKLIEKTLDSYGELESIRDAADVVWVGAELYKKWQDKDLKASGLTQKETLQKLSSIAEKTVESFTKDTNNVLLQDPLNWPVKVIAANSMYRITQTIMLAHKDENDQTPNDAELFERLSVMISDILSACLTNLARVIILKCHSNSIKEREKSVRQAALLVGESEEILEIIQQRELPPNVDPEKGGNIEGWRAFMEPENGSPVASPSATLPETNGEHVSIEIGR